MKKKLTVIASLMAICSLIYASTPYMGLSLPTVSSTPGPQWATLLNAAITTIDSHDHTTGKGVQVPSAGININSDLSFNSYNLTTLNSLQLVNQGSSLAVANAYSAVNGAPYFNNASSAPLPIVAVAGLATVGDIPYATSNTTYARLNAGTSGTFLKSNGPGQIPSYASAATATPITSKTHANTGYTLTGTDGIVLWTLTDASNDTLTVPLAATYGSGQTYTIKLLNTTASINSLTANRSGGDNFILINGTSATSMPFYRAGTQATIVSNGTATWYVTNFINPTQPTVQKFTSGSGTYTTALGAKYIEVEMVGAGGGGGAVTTNGGNTGDPSTFGTSLLTANGGVGAVTGGDNGGAGGSYTINSPAIGFGVIGGGGGPGSAAGAKSGGIGGSSALGGAPAGIVGAAAGLNAAVNSGAGGGGGNDATTGAGGGGSGAYIKATIQSPSATYSYTVGASGNGGAAGTRAGGNGGSGLIVVTEYY